MYQHLISLTRVLAIVCGHGIHSHNQQPVNSDQLAELEAKWGTDWGFTGIVTFAHLPHVKCLIDPHTTYDIVIVGAPFDTAVSYRPGARFGPRAIRAASARQAKFRSFNHRAGVNPYMSWAKIIDCGDIPVTPFDNMLALRQMSEAFLELGTRSVASQHHAHGSKSAKPRLVTLGGDHSIALPALRALSKVHGETLTVVHFDAHLDTWHPAKYPSSWFGIDKEFQPSFFNHGSMFWLAGEEGLLTNSTSVHAGLRTRLSGDDWSDNDSDSAQGWMRISSDDIDDIGTKGIIEQILSRVGTERPVYLSVDIDVLDPGLAPGTGTPEPGGWTTRELIRILRGVEDLNIVGADVVEVAPAYDGPGEATALAASQFVYEIVTNMVKRGLREDSADT